MQHAGLQYGQGATNSHQSAPFAHTDISHQSGGNTTSSLRQFRKKDTDKQAHQQQHDLGATNVGENSQIARVAPHNHYPARPPNDYYRYHPQYQDFTTPYKEAPQVKYSEIAEASPPAQTSIQHVDLSPIQKHKEKDFMEMCNITQQTHMKQAYPENLARQQSYPPDTSIHPQYLPKEPQVHHNYKPTESQYQQYPHQLGKYNMPPSQCRKYPTPEKYTTPPENDFLAKLQRLHPSMARSIMSDHHIREAQTYPGTVDQNRMYPQNPPTQRYYPPPPTIQNNSYQYHAHSMPQYNYSACSYKHDYGGRGAQINNARYPPTINPTERSISPRRTYQENLMNYPTVHQKITPSYPPTQYNHPPEYAQHYQHRRSSISQDYYQQNCRAPPAHHQYPPIPENVDNRSTSGLRHFLENWAEEEANVEISTNGPPIYKDNRLHDESAEQQVFVINSTDIPPQCLESLSLVPTENGQFIIKSGDNTSVVRILDKETNENNERTVNLQILENHEKSDCMLETATTSPDKEVEEEVDEIEEMAEDGTNEKLEQDCESFEEPAEEKEKPSEVIQEISSFEEILQEDISKKPDECTPDLFEELSNHSKSDSTKDMPPLDESKKQEQLPDTLEESETVEKEQDEEIIAEKVNPRTQRIFSVDDIINNIGTNSAAVQLQINSKRRNSLPLPQTSSEEEKVISKTLESEEKEEEKENETIQAISIENDSVILELGGTLVQLNINHSNGNKVLSVVPLSEPLIIDVNGNYDEMNQNQIIDEHDKNDEEEDSNVLEEEAVEEHKTEEMEDSQLETEIMQEDAYPNEIIVGEDIDEEEKDDEVPLEFTEVVEKPEISAAEKILRRTSFELVEETEDKSSQNRSMIIEMFKERKEIEQSHEKIEEILSEDQKNVDLVPKIDTSTEAAENTMDTTNIVTDAGTEGQPLEKNDQEEKPTDVSKSVEEILSEEIDSVEEIQQNTSINNNAKEPDIAENEVQIQAEEKNFEHPAAEDKNVEETETKELNTVQRLPEESTDTDAVKSEEIVHKIVPALEEKNVISELVPSKLETGQKKLSNPKKERRKSVDDRKEKSRAKEEKKSNSDKKDTIVKIEDSQKIKKSVKSESQKTSKSSTEKDRQKVKKSSKSNESKLPPTPEKVIEETSTDHQIIATNLCTKAAKKLYNDQIIPKKKHKDEKPKNMSPSSKLEETVKKIKSLKEKTSKEKEQKKERKVSKEERKKKIEKNDSSPKAEVTSSSDNFPIISIEPVEVKQAKPVKRVSFNLEPDEKPLSPRNEQKELDSNRRRLSWEEYSSRKRKCDIDRRQTISEKTVTSSSSLILEEVSIEKVELSIEKEINRAKLINQWEEAESPRPSQSSDYEKEPISFPIKTPKAIIDVNEFNIKPIDPSPVSSSQFSEDDSLQVYKDVVDSKLSSLNIHIPKVKPKTLDPENGLNLIKKFLSKSLLNCNELEKVKKIIEYKRRIEENEMKQRQQEYDNCVKASNPTRRKKKRFRNLYDDSSSSSSSSNEDNNEQMSADYSVYQRSSQGVPKLIIKRHSTVLPQPFVKLERSQAAEMLAKKRKYF